MSDEIIKILDDLGQRFGIAIDWSQDTILPYIEDLFHRILMREIYTSIVWIVIFLLACIGIAIAIPKIIKYANKVVEEYPLSCWDEGKNIVVVILLIILAIFIICIIIQIMDIITCVTVPEKIFLKFIESTKVQIGRIM